jgi:hypothetical protein
MRAFANAQEIRDGDSHKEGDDQENDHELDYRENFLDVFMTRSLGTPASRRRLKVS